MDTFPVGKLAHLGVTHRIANDERRLCVADEVLKLRECISGIERLVDRATFQGSQIKGDRGNRFLGLNCYPIARRDAKDFQCIRIARGIGSQLRLGLAHTSVRRDDRRPVAGTSEALI